MRGADARGLRLGRRSGPRRRSPLGKASMMRETGESPERFGAATLAGPPFEPRTAPFDGLPREWLPSPAQPLQTLGGYIDVHVIVSCRERQHRRNLAAKKQRE